MQYYVHGRFASNRPPNSLQYSTPETHLPLTCPANNRQAPRWASCALAYGLLPCFVCMARLIITSTHTISLRHEIKLLGLPTNLSCPRTRLVPPRTCLCSMLSRSNTTTSDRLRRSRSTASMQAARQRSSATSDPFVIRRHAEAAATQAYKRAQPAEQMGCPDYRPAPPGLHRRRSQVTGRSEGSHLEDARLGRRRSTARRDDIKSTPAASQKYQSSEASHAAKETHGHSRGAPPVQAEADVKSAHRKARFVTAPTEYQLKPPFALGNRSSPGRDSCLVPGSHSSSLTPTLRYAEKSYDDGISVTYMEPQSYANRTKAMSDHASSRRLSTRETQTDEEVIALARDRQLQGFSQHKVRERKSFFGSFQKLQRRDISDPSHSGGITYDSSLPPFNYADDSSIAHNQLSPNNDMLPPTVYPDGVMKKTRIFSGSMKTFKKLLRKASRAPSGFMPQRPEPVHHSPPITDQECLPTSQCLTMLSDPFIVQDSPLALAQNNLPLFTQGSVDSNVSMSGDAATDRSRVTSWANSTAAGTSSTFANTASTCAADEHGRLKHSNSQSRLRKKSSFFGRTVQNRLRKTSRADLKGSEDSQALFMALRERILPQDADEEKEHRAESAASIASQTTSSLSMLPSRRRADSLTPFAHGGASTVRTVSPDPDAYKIMSPVVEVSPDRVHANNESADQTPTTNHFASKRRAAPLQAEPPSFDRIARRVQQSQARWQGPLRTAPVAHDGKIGSAYDDNNSYQLPSLSRHPYQDVDTGGLPRHTKVSAPAPASRTHERLLSPSIYSRATDGASPRPVTPEEGGMTVTIKSREVKRYAISPPKRQEIHAERPVQGSGEWRKWLTDEMNSLTEADAAVNLAHVPAPVAASIALGPFSRDRSATTGSGSQKHGSDSELASRTRQGSRPRASSRRSSYMNERYPIMDSSDNSSRRTSRKYSMASNPATDTEDSLQVQGSDDSKRSPGVINTTSKTSVAKPLPKRHSLAHLESSSQMRASLPPTASKRSTSETLTMSGAIPDKDAIPATSHLRPPSHHHHQKNQSAFDLRAKYKTNMTSSSRPIEVRRKKSTPITVFEDTTIQNISAGPYAAAPPNAHANTNKENTPAAHHADDGNHNNLPALSSSEWLAGPTSRKSDPTARPKSSPPKSVGLGENGREGSPGQRLVTGWIQGRMGRVGGGEAAFA